MRSFRECMAYHYFLDTCTGLLSTRKVLNQELRIVKMKSSLRKTNKTPSQVSWPFLNRCFNDDDGYIFRMLPTQLDLSLFFFNYITDATSGAGSTCLLDYLKQSSLFVCSCWSVFRFICWILYNFVCRLVGSGFAMSL